MAGQRVIISVLADTKKVSRAFRGLSQELGLSRLGQGFKNLGSRIAGVFRTGIKWAGGFATALAGMALAGGLSRMMNIEDAEAKLRGLGHTTEAITAVMDDALESVKGTAFGLDSAATAAASAMAAGIAPGEELQKYLRGIADASTIAGTSMDDMSSIFGKIATAGRAQTTEINQIADRGIPIWAKLAETYGTTQEELRKMVSAGQVDAQTFYEAMDDLVGGAALEAGNTTRGAFANMRAAASRAGAAFLGSIFPMFKDALGGITEWLDGVTDRVAPIGEAIATWITGRALPAIQSFARWVRDDLYPVLQQLWQIVSGAVVEAFRTITAALGQAGVSAQGVGTGLREGLITALQTAGPILATIITGIGSFVAFLIEARDILIPYAGMILGAVAAFQAFQKVLVVVRAAQLAFNVVLAANPIGIVVVAIAALVGALVALWASNEDFRKAVTKLWNALVSFFKGAIDKIRKFFNGLGQLPSRIYSWFKGARDRAVSAMMSLVSWVAGLPGRIVGAAASLGHRLLTTATQAFGRFLSGAMNVGLRIVSWVRGLPGSIIRSLGNPGRILLNAGRAIIDGFLSGINNAFGRVRDTLSRLTNLLPSWKGPAEKDRKLLTGPADLIMDGLINQFERRFGDVRSVLGHLTSMIGATDLGELDAPGLGTISPAALTGSGRGATMRPENLPPINVYALMDGPEVGRRVVEAIRDYERVNGARLR